jgi:hypothetical protein
MKTRLCLIAHLLFVAVAHGQWIPLNPVVNANKTADGVVFTMQRGTMKVQVCSVSIIRVLYSATDVPNRTQYVVIKDHWPA